MKKYLFLFLIVSLFSCEDNKRNIVDTQEIVEKSKFYKEAIVQQGEDFFGLKLGDEFETAKEVLPEKYFIEEDENYLFYKIESTYTVAEYQLYFNENKLEEIDFDAIVYDEKGAFDNNGAIELFNDLKDDFIIVFGNKYMTSSEGENEILFWNKGNKNIQLILEKAKVHAYLDISFKE